MTTNEAKKLMRTNNPVLYDGIVYSKINALIFRFINGKYLATVELLDKNAHSVVVAKLDEITIQTKLE